MERLYAFSIRGKMLFFSGTISENEYDVVEQIANDVAINATMEEYIQKLINNVFSELNIALSYCPIEYVFRVRKEVGYHVN